MDVLKIVTDALSEKKADNIKVYDTTTVTPYMDTMIVASAGNERQNNALAQNIKDRLMEAGYEGPYRVEGNKDSRWQLVDLKDIVIHLFVKDERDMYQLDRLYADCLKETIE